MHARIPTIACVKMGDGEVAGAGEGEGGESKTAQMSPRNAAKRDPPGMYTTKEIYEQRLRAGCGVAGSLGQLETHNETRHR